MTHYIVLGLRLLVAVCLVLVGLFALTVMLVTKDGLTAFVALFVFAGFTATGLGLAVMKT